MLIIDHINDGDYMRELSKRIQKNYEVFFFIFVIIFTKYEKLALEYKKI